MAQSVTHDLRVELRPDSGVISVEDTIALGNRVDRVEFVLNAGLAVTSPDARLRRLETSQDGLRIAYRATFPEPAARLTLRYEGEPKFGGGRSMGGMPQGELGPEGVYLDSGSAWHPLFDAPIAGLDLQVSLPVGWESISIGRRQEIEGGQRWTTSQPHDSLYLLAAPYRRYARRHGDIDLSVWLLEDDPELAERYIGVMGGYIDHYSALIGAYPFAKFAVVENRWQTGYGMPSFTLLGSRVIRLPFIPYTSLPHEILHNWWGNGVWIDYAKGNWSEGLTAYLADHWMQERQGNGAQYRLKALQRYSNFAAAGRDQPLLKFVSRHNDASQSIGYSKSLMLFHMLRRQLGDQAFVAGLRRLWDRYQFTRVGFADVIAVITEGRPEVHASAQAWLERTGAARLKLDDATVSPVGDRYRLDFTVSQADPVFDLTIPIAITLEDRETAERREVRLSDRNESVSLTFGVRPIRLDVDPAYDVLRLLDASEQPPALNQLFGSDTWVVTPSGASREELAAWQRLIEQWQRRYPELRSLPDDEADRLPETGDRLILGWDNRLFGDAVTALRRDDQRLDANGAQLGAQAFGRGTHALVLVNTDVAGRTTGFIASPTVDGIQALTRKLPHYGSYGQLAFDATGDQNLLKQALTSSHSRLSRSFIDGTVPLHLPDEPVLGQP